MADADPSSRQYVRIDGAIFFCAIIFANFSVLAFHMRLTGSASTKWRIVHWTVFVILVLYLIANVGVDLAVCNPPIASLDIVHRGRYPNAKCLNGPLSGSAPSIAHIVIDFLLFIMTATVLVQTQLSLKVKIRLCFIFSIGLLTCLSAIVRLLYSYHYDADITCKRQYLQFISANLFVI